MDSDKENQPELQVKEIDQLVHKINRLYSTLRKKPVSEIDLKSRATAVVGQLEPFENEFARNTDTWSSMDARVQQLEQDVAGLKRHTQMTTRPTMIMGKAQLRHDLLKKIHKVFYWRSTCNIIANVNFQ